MFVLTPFKITFLILAVIRGWIAADSCIGGTFHIIKNVRILSNASAISIFKVDHLVQCFFHCSSHQTCAGFLFKESDNVEKGLDGNCILGCNFEGDIERTVQGDWVYYKRLESGNCNKQNEVEDSTNVDLQGEVSERNVSCQDLRKKFPSLPSGVYYISPKNSSTAGFHVFCDMISKGGVGVTVFGHDSESKTKVIGYESAGSYARNINYEATMEQIVAIIDQSTYCEQFIEYKCIESRLLSGGSGWWVSRQGDKMNYWGGAPVDSGLCACGSTASCVGGLSCNCDAEDEDVREDSGFLTDKNTLPVTQLRFGNTGDDSIGYHTLGKLHCWD